MRMWIIAVCAFPLLLRRISEWSQPFFRLLRRLLAFASTKEVVAVPTTPCIGDVLF